jgi:hypothetical protein
MIRLMRQRMQDNLPCEQEVLHAKNYPILPKFPEIAPLQLQQGQSTLQKRKETGRTA